MANVNKTIKELEKDSKKQMVIMSIIVCIIVAVGLFLAVHFNLVKLSNEVKINSKTISSLEDLKSLNEELLNDNYFLTNDIYIDEPFVLGSKDNPLSGTIYGNGHSIIINYAATNSLIYQIEKNAKVSNLMINYIVKTGEIIMDFGGITNYNYGVIKDCYVSFSEGVIVNSKAAIGGMVAVNYGSILNSIVNVDFMEKKELITGVRIGGFAGVLMKDAAIENCVAFSSSEYISNVDYDSVTSGYKFPNIGCVYGTKYDGVKIQNVYTLKTNDVYSDKFDGNIIWEYSIVFDEVQFYYDVLKLEKTAWKINSYRNIELVITNINE